MHSKQQKLTLILILHYMCMAHAQRPTFAGSRPAGGLSQKDKYNHPELAAGLVPVKETATADDIGNRFGATNNKNKLPPRPPVAGAGGLSIVYPESQYNPLPMQSQQQPQRQQPIWTAASNNNVNNDNALATRFGGNAAAENEVDNNRKEVPAVIPTDARGDEALVNQLSQLPLESQPFWFLNFKAIEAQRSRSVANGDIADPQFTSRSNFAG